MVDNVGRRRLLAMAGAGLLINRSLAAAAMRGSGGALFVACRQTSDGGHAASGFRGDGRLHFDLPLPARGHAMAFHPSDPVTVVFARRPGRFAVVIDYDQGVALARFDAAKDRHFYGHGTFSTDGRWLFTTENAYDKGAGVIGIRDAKDSYRQVGEVPSHGIGPHELVMLADGETLAIANGGIRTHPEHERVGLNLDEMAPSLTCLRPVDGKVLGDYRLDVTLHKLSIRHLALLGTGGIAIAMQYEGDKRHRVPLAAIKEGDRIVPLDAPAELVRRMRQYAGSVATDRAGNLIAVSAPRGNLVAFWDARDRRFLGSVDLPDGCGVAPTDHDGEFLLASGSGALMRVRPHDGLHEPVAVERVGRTSWDNHLRLAPA